MKSFSCVILIILLSGCFRENRPQSELSNNLPDIFPDYKDVTVPENIAPLNFMAEYGVQEIKALIKGSSYSFDIKKKGRTVIIPEKKWKRILKENSGDSIEVSLKTLKNNKWTSYKPFKIYISEIRADDFIVYRLIMPGFQNWNKMGIYQRSLTNFNERIIIDSNVLPGTCMNCHSFNRNNPESMLIHLRESYGGTVLYSNNHLEKLNTRTGKMFANTAFPSWHPSGKYIAFSVNRVNQIFHAAGTFRAAAVDMKSDIFIYNIEKNQMMTIPSLSEGNRFESFPCFSSDGLKLYYCSADSLRLPQKFDKTRYSLCSVSFDPETGKVGEKADTLISGPAINKSISMPRVSPDGKFIMFVMADYGCFPSYNPEADLYMLDIETCCYKPLTEMNSTSVDSWHSWSSEGRWVAFSSRRKDGVYSNIYFSLIGENGKATKPFILPQKDPSYYDRTLFSFNLPEFIREEVKTDIYDIEKIAKKSTSIQVSNESGH